MIPPGSVVCDSVGMRTGVEFRLGPGDRERLEAVVGSGNGPRKHVWRARIVLLSAEGIGTMEIHRRTGKSKPTIWRWQARFLAEGVNGLLHEATRPAGKPPLTSEVIERVVEMTLAEPPGETTHWTCRAMAKAAAVRHRTFRTKGALSQKTVKLMVFTLIKAASTKWRRLNGTNLLPRVIQGVKFTDGVAESDATKSRAA